MEKKLTFLKPSDKRCPVCGSYHIQGVSRITGYLSLDERFGEGKVNERAHRRDHNANHNHTYCAHKKQELNLKDSSLKNTINFGK